MDKLDEYAERLDPLRRAYQVDFIALEASWVARRQAVIDRVEATVPGAELAHDGLIEFLSAPIDRAHDRAVTDLFEAYQRNADELRREMGL